MVADKTTVEKTCFSCKQTTIFHLNTEQYEKWKAGALIQNVLWDLSADDRELLISGMCGKCFDDVFKDEEDKYYETQENIDSPPDEEFDLRDRITRRQDFSVPFGEAAECKALEEANLVCSDIPGWPKRHRPVLDFDFPCRLVPSTTADHYHLYIDFSVQEDKYFKLLDALQDCGLLQNAYVKHAKLRGYTAVRPPWIKKKQGEQNDSGEGK